MATVNQTVRRVKPVTESAHGVCRMTLEINGTQYGVKPVPPTPYGPRAYHVRHLPYGERYCVSQERDTGYIRCECADFEFRRSGTGTLCKHAAALVAFGMLQEGGAE